ncbi:hypothetical protein [Chryseobacterium indologenes]|uniref:Uncharacterized protein n=1 Tax=Chryseobacterium indologenes TaxID=253 RepID=A0A0N0IV34_CHRID|nr:hypothetical protein [Chryseobacterium indologenes]KPE50124.1 hypothetical protein AOB46_16935 [Chryseobacterium indologenes]
MNLSTYTEKDRRIIKIISDSVAFYAFKNKLIQNAKILTGVEIDIDFFGRGIEAAEEYFFEDSGLSEDVKDNLMDEFLTTFWTYEDQFDISKCISEDKHLFIASCIFLEWGELVKREKEKHQISHEN